MMKRNVTKAFFQVMGAILCSLIFIGCATLTDAIDIFKGKPQQKITRTPVWVYKPDLKMRINNENFKTGVGSAPLPFEGFSSIEIWSLINIDRVEVSTCARHDVCQKKAGELGCDKTRFDVSSDWFGNPGKFMTYKFAPSLKERQSFCSNAMIAIYDKSTLAAWGYIVFVGNYENSFEAMMSCNATSKIATALSVCSAKAGTIQQIRFSENIENFKAEENCGIKKINSQVFEFLPTVGWCRASFSIGTKFHDVIINAYDEVLVME